MHRWRWSFWSNRVPVSMVNRSVCGRGTHTHILASCPLVIRIKGWSRCFCVCFMDIEYRGESTCTHTHTDRRVCAPMLNVTPVSGNVDEKAQLSLLTNTQTTSSPLSFILLSLLLLSHHSLFLHLILRPSQISPFFLVASS